MDPNKRWDGPIVVGCVKHRAERGRRGRNIGLHDDISFLSIGVFIRIRGVLATQEMPLDRYRTPHNSIQTTLITLIGDHAFDIMNLFWAPVEVSGCPS